MAQSPDTSRRRFIKTGLITAPVIVTLSARPAWAQAEATATGYKAPGPSANLPTQKDSLFDSDPSLGGGG